MDLPALGAIFIGLAFGAREYKHYGIMVILVIVAVLCFGTDWCRRTGYFPP